MILVRAVFHAKLGKGGELAAMMAEGFRPVNERHSRRTRVLTDLSGQFDTVVLETVHDSLASWEQTRAEMFTTPEFQEAFARTTDLVVSGHQEYYTIEAEF